MTSETIHSVFLFDTQTDRELATELRRHVVEPARAHNRLIFERAAARGEMPRNVDTDVAMDMLYGAIWERLLVRHGPLDQRFAQTLVDLALTGLQSRQPPKTTVKTKSSPYPSTTTLRRGAPAA